MNQGADHCGAGSAAASRSGPGLKCVRIDSFAAVRAADVDAGFVAVGVFEIQGRPPRGWFPTIAPINESRQDGYEVEAFGSESVFEACRPFTGWGLFKDRSISEVDEALSEHLA